MEEVCPSSLRSSDRIVYYYFILWIGSYIIIIVRVAVAQETVVGISGLYIGLNEVDTIYSTKKGITVFCINEINAVYCI